MAVHVFLLLSTFTLLVSRFHTDFGNHFCLASSSSAVQCHITASAEQDHLNVIPCSYFFTRRPLSCHNGLCHCTLWIFLLFAGNIETNPGPPFSLCSLNIRSLNADHFIHLDHILSDHRPDLVALTETWLSSSHTPSELRSLTPSQYELLSSPRSSGKGGGVAFLVRTGTSYSFDTYSYTSFEALSVTIKLPKGKLSVLNLYHPPDSTSHSKPFSTFLTEFQSISASFATLPHPFVITGDFNIHVDNLLDSHAKQFLSLLESLNLTQHVSFFTHNQNHILDLVITAADSWLNPSLSCLSHSPSDHFPVFTSLSLAAPPPPPPTYRSFRRIAAIDIDQFLSDLSSSDLIRNPPSTLPDLVHCFDTTLRSLLDKHAPLVTKVSTVFNPWYSPALRALKKTCRKAENLWKRTRALPDLLHLKSLIKTYNDSIKAAKQSYYSKCVSSSLGNPRRLWNTVNHLLHRRPPSALPTDSSASISDTFASFFSDKILKIRTVISTGNAHRSVSPHSEPPPQRNCQLLSFTPATTDEIARLLNSSPDKQCDLDPIPTSLLKKCSTVLLPTLTNIINLSLTAGTFPDSFKHSVVTPLLKKPSLDKESLSNYRPISNLSMLSKLTEKLVKCRLTDYLSTNSLLNPLQSAYVKSHSTETVLLSLHDRLVKSIGKQELTAVCLLDLSAAFDTIDHDILRHRLSSWFHIDGTALSWISSYLSSRTFAVSALGQLSSVQPLNFGVPQGSVLGPLLFTLYTAPLSSLISSFSVDHHLYADDTQLFISFKPQLFLQTAELLNAVFAAVANWMASNMLSLNPSKTEFLVIGSPGQLSKLNSPTLLLSSETVVAPASSARNLGVIFDSHLSFRDHISSLVKSCFFHIRDLRRIRPYLDTNTAALIATSLVQSKLDYCNSLFLNLPAYELDRLQLVQNTLARVVTKSPRHCHITPVLRSLHWLKIRERITYKVMSLTFNCLLTSQPSYLRKLISTQPPRPTRSSSCLTLTRPPITSRSKIVSRSFSYEAPRLWNSLPAHLRPVSLDTSSTAVVSIPRSTFCSRLKTHLFKISYPEDTAQPPQIAPRSRRPPLNHLTKPPTGTICLSRISTWLTSLTTVFGPCS